MKYLVSTSAPSKFTPATQPFYTLLTWSINSLVTGAAIALANISANNKTSFIMKFYDL